jgi:hypothetical protein
MTQGISEQRETHQENIYGLCGGLKVAGNKQTLKNFMIYEGNRDSAHEINETKVMYKK